MVPSPQWLSIAHLASEEWDQALLLALPLAEVTVAGVLLPTHKPQHTKMCGAAQQHHHQG